MHILITDSGVGGLSVVAYAERFVREHGFTEPVRFTFANAAPENDYGYNSMPSRDVKIETFERFLRNVTARFAPDSIYVACNTLSVLLPFVETTVPVKGIVESAVELLLRELSTNRTAIIFGTQTTIDAGTYPRLLASRGVDASRVISQACPGLADTISEDREGSRTRQEIRMWVNRAIAQLPRRDVPVVACLACTHYGYRKDDFITAFRDADIDAIVVNPNERAVDDLFGIDPASVSHETSVEFITRYAIPATTIEALTFFLEEISPKTVDAMKNYVLIRDLF